MPKILRCALLLVVLLGASGQKCENQDPADPVKLSRDWRAPIAEQPVSAIPEPTGCLLFGIGALGLLLFLHRTRR